MSKRWTASAKNTAKSSCSTTTSPPYSVGEAKAPSRWTRSARNRPRNVGGTILESSHSAANQVPLYDSAYLRHHGIERLVQYGERVRWNPRPDGCRCTDQRSRRGDFDWTRQGSRKFTIFTDIQGDEDHFGDMDFKVAGTQRGITGIELDLKVDGISEEIIRATLDQAREGRREILKAMLLALRKPRPETSKYAPGSFNSRSSEQDWCSDRQARLDHQGTHGGDRGQSTSKTTAPSTSHTGRREEAKKRIEG